MSNALKKMMSLAADIALLEIQAGELWEQGRTAEYVSKSKLIDEKRLELVAARKERREEIMASARKAGLAVMRNVRLD